MDIKAYEHEKRTKRAIEFIGPLYNWAFRLMDAKTARKYDDAINNIANLTTRVNHIVGDHTALIREMVRLTNQTFNHIDDHMNWCRKQNNNQTKKWK